MNTEPARKRSWLRLLFAIALLLNAAFLAFGLWREGRLQGEPERVQQQLDAERIVLAGRGERPAAQAAPGEAKSRAKEDAKTEKPADGKEAGKNAEKLSGEKAAEEKSRCLMLSGLSPAMAAGLRDDLVKRHAKAIFSLRPFEEQSAGWVYIPATSRQAAERKLAEVRGMGVTDASLLQEGGRWTVSLGLFSGEEGARTRLEALHAKGVRSARSGTRQVRIERTDLQILVPVAEAQAIIDEVAQSAPAVKVESCAPAAGGQQNGKG